MCSCVLSCFSHVQLFAILWTVTCQVPLSMGFSRQGYWSVLPFPPPGDLPASEIKPASLMYPHWHVGSLPLVQPGKPIKPLYSRSHKSLGCSSLSMNVIYIIWKRVKQIYIVREWKAYQRNPLTIVMSKYLTVIFISSCSLLEVECIRINLAANNQKPAKYLSSKAI